MSEKHPLDFSISGSLSVLLQQWVHFMPRAESDALVQLYAWIHSAIEQARSVPPTVDRRAIALVITKLEEAEHWVLECMRMSVDSALREESKRSARELVEKPT